MGQFQSAEASCTRTDRQERGVVGPSEFRLRRAISAGGGSRTHLAIETGLSLEEGPELTDNRKIRGRGPASAGSAPCLQPATLSSASCAPDGCARRRAASSRDGLAGIAQAERKRPRPLQATWGVGGSQAFRVVKARGVGDLKGMFRENSTFPRKSLGRRSELRTNLAAIRLTNGVSAPGSGYHAPPRGTSRSGSS